MANALSTLAHSGTASLREQNRFSVRDDYSISKIMPSLYAQSDARNFTCIL